MGFIEVLKSTHFPLVFLQTHLLLWKEEFIFLSQTFFRIDNDDKHVTVKINQANIHAQTEQSALACDSNVKTLFFSIHK